MSRTLVISDNEFLNILYMMNLEVYLGTDVDLATTYETAQAMLKSKTKYDLVIALHRLGGVDISKALLEFRGSYGIKSPVVIVGGENDREIDLKTFVVASKYALQPLLKRSATILGVTAKQMAAMDVGEYYPLSLASLESLSRVPCNLYVQQDEKSYKSLARANDPLEQSFKQIREQGIDKIFVKSHDRLSIVNNVSIKLIERITAALKNADHLSTDKKVELLNDGYEFAAANLFSSEEIKQEMQEIATASAKVMQDVVKDSTHLKNLLASMLHNKSGYIFTHSLIASYTANHIIKNVAWGGEGQSEKINFVLFFHDIYLAPLYLKYPNLGVEQELLTSKELTEKEKEIFLNHAKLAAELVVSYKRCPMGADVLIKQHHGMKKGSGFALRFPEDLSPLSKVLVVAEAFVEQFMICQKENRKVEMKIIIPKLIEDFQSQSYIKIVQTLVNLPL